MLTTTQLIIFLGLLAIMAVCVVVCAFITIRSRQQLIQFQQAIPYPILWWDKKRKRIHFCNNAYRALFPTESDAYPTSWLPLAEKAFVTKSKQEEERHVVTAGKRLLLNLYACPMLGTSYIIGAVQDKTSLEEASEELARYISAQSDLLESSSSAIAIYDRDARLQFYNHSFLALWKLDEAWLGKHPTYDQVLEQLRERRLLPEQANFPAFKKEKMKLFSNLIEPLHEYYYLPNDQVLRVLMIPQVLGGILFSYEDMTDRLVLERSYNTLIAVQRTTLDNLHESVAVFNQNGKLALFNAPFAKLWDFEQEFLASGPHIQELLERVRYLLSEDVDWQDYKARIFSPMNTRRLMQARIALRNGKVIERTIVPLPDGATMLSHLDVSDTIRAEKSLRERNEALEGAERMKTEFLAKVSYDMRSPLTTIMGLTELLEQKLYGDLNARQKEYIDAIGVASKRLQYVINDILDMVSLQAPGHIMLDSAAFDLVETIKECVVEVNEQREDKKIEEKWIVQSINTMIQGDTRRIKHMLHKLLQHIANDIAPRTKVKFMVEQTENNEYIHCVFNFRCRYTKDLANWLALDKAELITPVDPFLSFSVIRNVVALHHGTLHVNRENKNGIDIAIALPIQQRSESQ